MSGGSDAIGIEKNPGTPGYPWPTSGFLATPKVIAMEISSHLRIEPAYSAACSLKYSPSTRLQGAELSSNEFVLSRHF